MVCLHKSSQLRQSPLLTLQSPHTFTGYTVLAGAEENQQSQLRADEAFTGPWRCGKNQVGHSVGCGVDPTQAGAAQALSTCDGLQTLQPERQHKAVTLFLSCHAFYKIIQTVWWISTLLLRLYLCFSEKLLMSCSMVLSDTRSIGLLPLWLA